MKTKKFRRKLYHLINDSDRFRVASLTMDFYASNLILIELTDGSKFQIIIMPTNRFV